MSGIEAMMTRRTTLVHTAGLAVVLLWLLAGCTVADQRQRAEDPDIGLRVSSAGNGRGGGERHTEISNGKIAFIRHSDTYVMNSDGTGQTNLTRTKAGVGGCVWSPNGKKIAFIRTTRVVPDESAPSSAAPATGPSGLYTMNPDGTALRKLSMEMSYAQSPLWSPDGKQIAFSGSEQKVYVVNANGTQLRELLPNIRASYVDSYAWSPDGKEIAFAAVNYRGDLDIYMIIADGTGQTNLTSTRDSIEDELSWSSDGKQIAFTRGNVGGDVYGDRDVYVMDADGTGQKRLANNASSPSFEPWDGE